MAIFRPFCQLIVREVRSLYQVTGSFLRPLGGCVSLTPYQCAFSTTPAVRGHVFRQIFRTLRAAWYRKRPRLIGSDTRGNRFFEIPPNKGSEHSTKSSRSRRFVLLPGQESVNDAWMSLSGDLPDMDPEWCAWLRHRRDEPPTQSEIETNAAAVARRQMLAGQLESKYEAERAEMIREGLMHDSSSTHPGHRVAASTTSGGKPKVAFPVRRELETIPGEGFITKVSGSDKSS